VGCLSASERLLFYFYSECDHFDDEVNSEQLLRFREGVDNSLAEGFLMSYPRSGLVLFFSHVGLIPLNQEIMSHALLSSSSLSVILVGLKILS
jgi:hypothetical protein